MTKKERLTILNRMVQRFRSDHADWIQIKNPSDLPYLAIFLRKRISDDLWLFVGFYNWRREKFSATVGWLSREWHPRQQELVARYLEEDGTLKQVRLRGSEDFNYADFERDVGGLIPVSLGIAKPYDATSEDFPEVAEEMCADIVGPGFEYLDLMLQHRFGKRLADVLA